MVFIPWDHESEKAVYTENELHISHGVSYHVEALQLCQSHWQRAYQQWQSAKECRLYVIRKGIYNCQVLRKQLYRIHFFLWSKNHWFIKLYLNHGYKTKIKFIFNNSIVKMVFLAVLKLKGVTKNMANNRCLSLLSLKISLKWEQENVVSKYMGKVKG